MWPQRSHSWYVKEVGACGILRGQGRKTGGGLPIVCGHHSRVSGACGLADGKGWEQLAGQCLIGAGWGLKIRGARGALGEWGPAVKKGSCPEAAQKGSQPGRPWVLNQCAPGARSSRPAPGPCEGCAHSAGRPPPPCFPESPVWRLPTAWHQGAQVGRVAVLLLRGYPGRWEVRGSVFLPAGSNFV